MAPIKSNVYHVSFQIDSFYTAEELKAFIYKTMLAEHVEITGVFPGRFTSNTTEELRAAGLLPPERQT